MIGTRYQRGLFGAIMQMSQGRPLFTAEYYAIDGISGKVGSFVDWNDPTHLLAQSLGAKQVALPAVHADFAGKLCATFDGATSIRWYQSNRPAISWNYLVNGPSRAYSTMTVTASGATQVVWETDNTGGGGASYTLSSLNVMRHTLFRTGGSASIGVTSIFTNNVAGICMIGISGYDPRRIIKKSGITAETASLLNTDIATSSSLTFGGRSSNDTFPLKARVRHLLITMPELGAQEEAAVYSYFLQDSGLAA